MKRTKEERAFRRAVAIRTGVLLFAAGALYDDEDGRIRSAVDHSCADYFGLGRRYWIEVPIAPGVKVTIGSNRLLYAVYNGGDVPKGAEVDHVNEVGTDNRPTNLQALDHRQNIRKSFEHRRRLGKVYGAELAARAKEMRRAGVNLTWIAGELGVSEAAVTRLTRGRLDGTASVVCKLNRHRMPGAGDA